MRSCGRCSALWEELEVQGCREFQKRGFLAPEPRPPRQLNSSPRGARASIHGRGISLPPAPSLDHGSALPRTPVPPPPFTPLLLLCLGLQDPASPPPLHPAYSLLCLGLQASDSSFPPPPSPPSSPPRPTRSRRAKEKRLSVLPLPRSISTKRNGEEDYMAGNTSSCPPPPPSPHTILSTLPSPHFPSLLPAFTPSVLDNFFLYPFSPSLLSFFSPFFLSFPLLLLPLPILPLSLPPPSRVFPSLFLLPLVIPPFSFSQSIFPFSSFLLHLSSFLLLLLPSSPFAFPPILPLSLPPSLPFSLPIPFPSPSLFTSHPFFLPPSLPVFPSLSPFFPSLPYSSSIPSFLSSFTSPRVSFSSLLHLPRVFLPLSHPPSSSLQSFPLSNSSPILLFIPPSPPRVFPPSPILLRLPSNPLSSLSILLPSFTSHVSFPPLSHPLVFPPSFSRGPDSSPGRGNSSEPDSTQAPGPRFPLIEEDAATLRYPPRPFLPIRAHNDTFGRPFVIILRGRISTAAREKRRAGKVDAVDGRFSERNGVR
ncbi:hypothetical protein C7M84_021737 [Penaeus vannamei]|uniref:Uncharacterized protein n=1 Tax=Penaeus vannamei TaxID=6689 RepID=A0A3R7LR60_PENVA|nr:hypothetical protein C7M84_021737 [Penaeus vannamei]